MKNLNCIILGLFFLSLVLVLSIFFIKINHIRFEAFGSLIILSIISNSLLLILIGYSLIKHFIKQRFC